MEFFHRDMFKGVFADVFLDDMSHGACPCVFPRSWVYESKFHEYYLGSISHRVCTEVFPSV